VRDMPSLYADARPHVNASRSRLSVPSSQPSAPALDHGLMLNADGFLLGSLTLLPAP